MLAIQETRFDPWVRKIPLEKGMVIHSSILEEKSVDRRAWRAAVHGVGSKRVRYD